MVYIVVRASHIHRASTDHLSFGPIGFDGTFELHQSIGRLMVFSETVLLVREKAACFCQVGQAFCHHSFKYACEEIQEGDRSIGLWEVVIRLAMLR